MKTSRMPLIVFVLCCLGYLGLLAWTVPMLPNPVATHFGLRGQADGWMSHRFYLCFDVLMGIGLPWLIVGLFYVARFLPTSCWNLQNRDYWLAPERRGETCGYFLRRSFWLASLTVLFMAGLHLLTIEANRQVPPALSMRGLGIVSGGFILLMLAWLVPLLRRFKKVS